MTTPGLHDRSVSTKWLIGILTTIVLAGGGGWMTFVQAQLSDVKREQQTEKDIRARQAADVEVIKEKVKRLEQDTQEIKSEQRETNRKLDELLRRVR